MIFRRSILAAILVVAATPALAHTGAHSFSGFTAGFLHPIGGFDHLLAMVGVGLFAASLGGWALWAVPASFVLMMVVGGAFGLAGTAVPAVETGIAASVIALGTIVTLNRSWPLSAAMALVGAFAVFHGYAHGVEIPAGAGAVAYSLGFALASAALHGLGMAMHRTAHSYGGAVRSAGATITVAGLVLMIG